jgi:hypothetical protein
MEDAPKLYWVSAREHVDCLASYDLRIDCSQAYLLQAKDSKRQAEEASCSEGTVGYM